MQCSTGECPKGALELIAKNTIKPGRFKGGDREAIMWLMSLKAFHLLGGNCKTFKAPQRGFVASSVVRAITVSIIAPKNLGED